MRRARSRCSFVTCMQVGVTRTTGRVLNETRLHRTALTLESSTRNKVASPDEESEICHSSCVETQQRSDNRR